MKVEVTRCLKNVFQAKVVDGTVHVRANWRLSNSDIRQILIENQDWVQSHCDNKVLQTNNNLAETHAFHSAEKDMQKPISGFEYPIKVNSTFSTLDVADMFCFKSVLVAGELYCVQPSLVNKTYIDNDKLFVGEEIYLNKADREKAVKSFLKRMCRSVCSGEVAEFGTLVGVCAEKIDFKELKNCWTKCDDAVTRCITIDFRIVQLPLQLRRYIVAHAFAHFYHADHNQSFWNCLSNFVPQAIEYQRQLDRYSFLLEI